MEVCLHLKTRSLKFDVMKLFKPATGKDVTPTGSKTQSCLFIFCPLKVKYIDFVDVNQYRSERLD